MSAQTPSGVPGGGIMRRLSGGKGGGRFAGMFEFADALFSPSKTAARVEREQQRRRRVAIPAPGAPPADGAVEAIVALPTGLLGPIELDDDPPARRGPAGDGGSTAPSAPSEQPPDELEQRV